MSGKLKKEKCEFENHGVCKALACYSGQKCGARDSKGNPKYADFGVFKGVKK